MNHQEMQSIIDKAGIHYTEAARLFDGITRQTLAGWFRGVAPKNRSIYERAGKICQIISVATTAGFFPLDPGMRSRERMAKIMEILRKTMKQPIN